jgi:uncharacterized membrane protein YheB (UPF0754 family)
VSSLLVGSSVQSGVGVVGTALQSGIDFGRLSAIDWRLALIPLISGAIGYATNWVGIRLLFYPVGFVGVRVPGLREVARLLPRKLQQIPGVSEGRLGWEGIIPSRAAKMGSISVDKGISRIGSGREFYERFDPDAIAAHVLETVDGDVEALADELMRERHPRLWRNTPPLLREVVHARVRRQLPAVVERITDGIGEHIDDLLDVKLMVIRRFEERPELLNRMFLEVGDRELDFIIRSGFLIGTPLGVLTIPLFVLIGEWWVLPVAGVFVGYTTNWIAIKLIFNPVEERRIAGFRLQGLFIRRQQEVARVYAEIIADELITLANVADELVSGPRGDRTRELIEDALWPVVDDAVGPARPLVRLATGVPEYDALRAAVASEGVEYATEPLEDPEFNRERSDAIRVLFRDRMQEMPPDEYAEVLRSAFEEDEWLLILIGAALGFVAGWLQLLLVTAL